jgi:hypothetical protein
VSGIVDFYFIKCNEYFVKRWELAQRNIRKAGLWGKATTHFIKEGEELAKQHIVTPLVLRAYLAVRLRPERI